MGKSDCDVAGYRVAASRDKLICVHLPLSISIVPIEAAG